MRNLVATAAVLAGAFLSTAQALLVAPQSPCSVSCGNVLDSTSPADIQCDQGAYTTSSNGIVFSNCVHCELTSTYTSGVQTDLEWMLYNLRYAFSYCIFGFPNSTVDSNPCITSTACGPLIHAIEFNSLNKNSSSFDYCALWNSVQVGKCNACLRAGSEYYFANFLTLLDAGCQQQPIAGSTISIEGEPFSSAIVNLTTPTPKPYTGPYIDSGAFPLGAKVGVAIAGLVVLLALAGCCVVWNGKRRRRAFLRRLETQKRAWPTPTGGQVDMFETPLSQRPLRGWDDSPMSAGTEKTFGRYFSPYSSQYNSPVSAVDMPNMQWPQGAMMPQQLQPEPQLQQQPREIGIALGGDDSSGHWDPPEGESSKHRDKDSEESYEMHQVDIDHYNSFRGRLPQEPSPPVLHHPGYGRQGGSPPRWPGLTAEDARNGYAL